MTWNITLGELFTFQYKSLHPSVSDTNYEYTTWVKFDTDLQFKEAFRYEMVTEEKIPISIRKFEPALFVNAVRVFHHALAESCLLYTFS